MFDIRPQDYESDQEPDPVCLVLCSDFNFQNNNEVPVATAALLSQPRVVTDPIDLARTARVNLRRMTAPLFDTGWCCHTNY